MKNIGKTANVYCVLDGMSGHYPPIYIRLIGPIPMVIRRLDIGVTMTPKSLSTMCGMSTSSLYRGFLRPMSMPSKYGVMVFFARD